MSNETSRQEMVIFTRTFDLLDWLLPATNNLPKAHRFTFTKRMLDAAFDLRERLDEASCRKGAERRESSPTPADHVTWNNKIGEGIT